MKVNFSELAAPIVIVSKKEGRIRICGDYKVNINQALTVDQYVPPEELFATLANGEQFTKLDMSQAYLQLQLEEPYVTCTVDLNPILATALRPCRVNGCMYCEPAFIYA